MLNTIISLRTAPLFATEALITALCRTTKAQHPLYLLCCTHQGQAVLDKLIIANPDLFTSEMVVTELKQSYGTNGSALSKLQESPTGQVVLQKLEKLNPDLCSETSLSASGPTVEESKVQRFFLPPSTQQSSPSGDAPIAKR